MKKLSSDMTWFMKYGFPVIWIGGFGFGTVMMFIDPEISANPMGQIESSKWFFVLGLLLGTAMTYYLLIRLKKVSLDDKEFVISNFREEIRVNISDVEKITGSILLSPELVWLHLKTQTRFGNKIQFMAPQRFFSFGLTRNPLVAELNEMVK